MGPHLRQVGAPLQRKLQPGATKRVDTHGIQSSVRGRSPDDLVNRIRRHRFAPIPWTERPPQAAARDAVHVLYLINRLYDDLGDSDVAAPAVVRLQIKDPVPAERPDVIDRNLSDLTAAKCGVHDRQDQRSVPRSGPWRVASGCDERLQGAFGQRRGGRCTCLRRKRRDGWVPCGIVRHYAFFDEPVEKAPEGRKPAPLCGQ